ncbi:5-formyltetrahydrofolate cyclo-ligase [Seleniivibrio woodruffii]|uniref:5-formyltetrahydrofolate cyclo-ligase n=1 Tax=Seleniivibrio woodruffii TaxID=1078050 RepID=UPI0026F162A2|nr:5-formyltetrahydrofolate cyclo-ligase [Seleniivibrio woodruffii]
MEKAKARCEALERRNNLDAAYAGAASLKITERFLAEFSEFDSFLLYAGFKGEVDTTALISILYGMKKAVYLPRVRGGGIELGLYKGENSLICGAYGICEPAGCTDYESIDVAAVPGVAFDRRLVRVGWGKGYYDRLLAAGKIRIAAGLAFECQLFDSIEAEPHDIPCDVLVTETDIYRRNS